MAQSKHYEEFLKKHKSLLPRHLAIIMDGNRRYAKKKGMLPWEGHRRAVKTIENIIKWCLEFRIKEITLYAFSTENFRRSNAEVKHLFELFKSTFEKVINEKESSFSIHKNKIRICFIGRLWMFSKDIEEMMQTLMQKTRNYSALKVNFAMGYGGRFEIVDATKSIAKEAKEGKIDIDKIDSKYFAKHLYLESDVDLLIRTSGEKRISNYLPWQLSYAEFYFEPKLFPEFQKRDFMKALYDYSNRDRRFGRR